MYDLIGDIHGHADELTELLTKLGYKLRNGVWSNDHRMIIFLGDYIDRGPQQESLSKLFVAWSRRATRWLLWETMNLTP